jgi:hypothetical protein
MRNYLIRATLTVYLERENTPTDVIERFEARMTMLRDAESYPCPACFVWGEEQPLDLRLAGDRVDQAFCPKCKRHFEVQAPKG